MKPSLRFLLIFLALLAMLPASALALRPTPGDQLARAVQGRALRWGDRGEQVANLQGLLRERGFDPGPIDGLFGPLTLSAVHAAQASYRLEVDGLAGRLTVGALRNDTGAVAVAAPDAAGLVIYQAESGPPQAGELTRLVSELAPLRATPALSTAVPAGGEVALTFNGLPDEAALESILEHLEERAMAATFFVPGERAEERPDLVARISRAGHEVASLGFTGIDMRRVSPMTARALVRRTQRAIADATGVEPAFFRPPLGRFDQNLTRLVEEEGLQLVLWSNVSVRPVPEMEPERLAEHLSGSLFPRAVLMLPLDQANARGAVEPLLKQMEASGYRSRTLSDLITTP